MKLPPLLDALLLSASPALADDFVDLKRDAMVSLITKQVSTNQALENQQIEEQGFYKVNPSNRRLMRNQVTGKMQPLPINEYPQD